MWKEALVAKFEVCETEKTMENINLYSQYQATNLPNKSQQY